MAEIPTYEELSNRIRKHLAIARDDDERREISIAWSAYVAGLLEWDLLSVDDHHNLRGLLPKVENNPTFTIATGIDD